MSIIIGPLSITPARKFRMLLHTNPTRERGECLGTRAWRVGRYVRFESPLHAGLQVAGDREPKEIREQFKAWCTRRLKALQQERLRSLSAQDCSAAAIRQKWWAERGSALYVNDEEGLEAVIHYVREAQDHADQPQPDERERSQS